VVSFTHRPLYLRRNCLRNPLDRRLGGPQGLARRREKRGKNLLLLPGIEPQTLGLPAPYPSPALRTHGRIHCLVAYVRREVSGPAERLSSSCRSTTRTYADESAETHSELLQHVDGSDANKKPPRLITGVKERESTVTASFVL
jgi:hypothetical protein